MISEYFALARSTQRFALLALGRAWTLLGSRKNSKRGKCSKMPQNPTRQVHALLARYFFARYYFIISLLTCLYNLVYKIIFRYNKHDCFLTRRCDLIKNFFRRFVGFVFVINLLDDYNSKRIRFMA